MESIFTHSSSKRTPTSVSKFETDRLDDPRNALQRLTGAVRPRAAFFHGGPVLLEPRQETIVPGLASELGEGAVAPSRVRETGRGGLQPQLEEVGDAREPVEAFFVGGARRVGQKLAVTNPNTKRVLFFFH